MFFDIDDLSDEKSNLPHMLPSTVKFASRMKKMGIGDGARIVVYDTTGIFSAARVWWTFRAMGHKDVAVLNGGLKKWKAEGRPLEDGLPPKRTERHYTPLQNTEIIRDLDEMKKLVEEGEHADRRCASRRPFRRPRPRAATGPEVRPHPGLEKHALADAPQCRRHVQIAGRTHRAVQVRRHRCRASRS